MLPATPRSSVPLLAAFVALAGSPAWSADATRAPIALEPIAYSVTGVPEVATDASGYDEFIVKYRGAAKRSRAEAEAWNGTVLARVGKATGLDLVTLRPLGTGAELVAVRGGRLKAKAQAQLAEAFGKAAPVAYVEPNVRATADAVNDYDYGRQWALWHPDYGIRWNEARQLASGYAVNVAVLDTGLVFHPDIGRIAPGYDFITDPGAARDAFFRDNDPTDMGDWTVDNQCGAGIRGRASTWHGTHVAGTIGANGNNGLGIAGVSEATIVPVRVLGACGGTIADIMDGMIWAAGGRVPNQLFPGYVVGDLPVNRYRARVLNMSLSAPQPCTAAWADALLQVERLGAVTVVSAGNKHADARESAPAGCPRAITVGATGRRGLLAAYSNFGPAVDVLAPGGDDTYDATDSIWSTVDVGTTSARGGGYRYMQGTSMAAPQVAGVIALMLQLRPSLTPEDIRFRIGFATRPASAGCGHYYCGVGIIDAKRAVAALGYPIEIE